MLVKQIYENAKELDKSKIKIKGWVVTSRGNKKIQFIELNDGSSVLHLQLVLKSEKMDLNDIHFKTGSSIKAEGILNYTPKAEQSVELIVDKISLLAQSDEDFPIQTKKTTLEFLRTIPHLRHRSNTIKAVMLVRSSISFFIHEYFQKNDFSLVAAPIITSNDGEGAGETFIVDSEDKEPFFGNNVKATLGVTGQLHAEAYALGLQKVYTFAPTFRAENSNTKKHAAEFWMVEPEVAFFTLKELIQMSEEMLKYVIKKVLEKRRDELVFLDTHIKPGLIQSLEDFLESNLEIIEYRKVIEILEKNKVFFEEQNIEFGMDLKTEHERFIAEKYAKGPVGVINYPKKLKAFYMYQNDDNETVAAFDLLVPGIGELVGGSQRENRYEKLEQRIQELNIDQKDIQWYLDLRKYGYSGSAGFGLGLERLVMYITGIDNIRDSIPFPRTPNNLKM
ncbi:asparagine--tRNA ligase [Mycoplasmopsis pulmonis]|nr:asparagine--tRNA ligase [Mycoplasmopsis pulmonis]MDZ7293386.1 asparagine--tRNA ligase [Mycoplasmopsis pulmonis]VEU68533.1 lysyl-tRNA synthetase [Mycoplasmopsis pulmonis]